MSFEAQDEVRDNPAKTTCQKLGAGTLPAPRYCYVGPTCSDRDGPRHPPGGLKADFEGDVWDGRQPPIENGLVSNRLQAIYNQTPF